MTRKRILLGTISLLLIVILYLFIQFNSVKHIEQNCLTYDFEDVFEKENSLVLNKTYDFSQIFNCKSWDKMIIVGGPKANRTIIFLKEGVFLPEIDYINRIQGCLLFYLVKDGRLISPPIEFWHSHFLYFEDFNDFDYVSLNRQDAIFKCIKLETIGGKDEILTFERIGNGGGNVSD
ncbi:hypothetical protein E0W68_03065 [Flavobacterium salilacus subsp. salilacus]|uniref:hypothetical protein n=1 Tax=Flavobacterium TaxID=237 RepID=UPI001074DD4A|nr:MULTISPECIES: hypothetical protein [Flavobacterium]KAF2519345.1 hypothetical protein E0W68_03065 [Flavobacterium salilacus subsp. salilacus]MBE1614766.1 hypothetical protein [Flavobacterium sp. SaA2.13]